MIEFLEFWLAQHLGDVRFGQQLVFLLGFLDAFLLRLVDYRGSYLVRTGGSDWEERRL